MQTAIASSRMPVKASLFLLTCLMGVLFSFLALPGAFAQETTAGIQGTLRTLRRRNSGATVEFPARP